MGKRRSKTGASSQDNTQKVVAPAAAVPASPGNTPLASLPLSAESLTIESCFNAFSLVKQHHETVEKIKQFHGRAGHTARLAQARWPAGQPVHAICGMDMYDGHI
jgi:hypothetical protein